MAHRIVQLIIGQILTDEEFRAKSQSWRHGETSIDQRLQRCRLTGPEGS